MNSIQRLSTCLLISAALAACNAPQSGAPTAAAGAQADASAAPAVQPEAAAPVGTDSAQVTLTMDKVRAYMQAQKNLGELEKTDSSIDSAMNVSHENTAEYVARLDAHAGMSKAIESAGLSTREFAGVGETLISAMIAYGAVEAGQLKTIPDGIDPAAVEFVKQHQAELKTLMSGDAG